MSRVDRIVMEEQDTGRRPPAAPRTGRRPRGGHDWLEAKLKGLYDEVAREPLPDQLQKLIDELHG
ncbi:NepR family anti-sigma factor [Stella sp.]|uniref:NepR family anti-sigma factor n=1 Tax=Stella sp. TaxID=2912054 RepID=UPI0035B2EB7D